MDPNRLAVIRGLFRLLLDDDDDVQAAAEEGLQEILETYAEPNADKYRRRFRTWVD